jgi:hypothetical protein
MIEDSDGFYIEYKYPYRLPSRSLADKQPEIWKTVAGNNIFKKRVFYYVDEIQSMVDALKTVHGCKNTDIKIVVNWK